MISYRVKNYKQPANLKQYLCVVAWTVVSTKETASIENSEKDFWLSYKMTITKSHTQRILDTKCEITNLYGNSGVVTFIDYT